MTAGASSGRLIRMVTGENLWRCLILPGAGAGLLPYSCLAVGLGDAVGLTVDFVRSVGLMPGERPEESVAQMADSVVAVLDDAARGDSAAMPKSILGWSLGGLVCWEVCVRLAERGLLPDLVMVDSSPIRREPEPGEAESLRERIVEGMRGFADASTIERMLRTFESQVTAFFGYEAREAYSGRALLLSCAPQDTDVRIATERRWRELAPHLEVDSLDASHYEAFEEAYLPELISKAGAFFRRGIR